MPSRVCTNCGQLHPLGAHCPNTTGNTSWNGRRDRAAQARFRRAVLAHAGHQCQAIDPTTGARCPTRHPLEAHHTRPGEDNPATGLALCRRHHRAIDRHAR